VSTSDLTYYLGLVQNRVDIAEHFFTKLPTPVVSNDEELIFETCFIIGDSALARCLPEIAITWLQRANDHFQSLSIMTLMKFPDYDNWNLVIRHSLGEWADLVDDLD
jgi:Meiosis protein SPO22/ZIP4 like.